MPLKKESVTTLPTFCAAARPAAQRIASPRVSRTLDIAAELAMPDRSLTGSVPAWRLGSLAAAVVDLLDRCDDLAGFI